MAFLWMNGREEELEDGVTVVCTMGTLFLWAAHDPKAPFLCFGKGVQAAFYELVEVVVEDDFDASCRFTTATMHYLRA